MNDDLRMGDCDSFYFCYLFTFVTSVLDSMVYSLQSIVSNQSYQCSAMY